MNYRVSSLLDSVQICIETVLLSPVIIGCSIEHFFQCLKELIEDAIFSQRLYERLDFELREAKNDAWAANLVLKDANEGWRKERIRRCKALAAWCDSNVYAMKISAMNEVISGCKSFYKNREIWWGKWRDRFHKLERYYKELETEDR